MTQYLVGLLLFFGVHAISIISDDWRNTMAARIGEWPWKAIYGLISIIGLVLIIRGYELVAPQSALLYIPPAWLRPVSLVLLLPVFPLLLAAYLPGRIHTLARHPMLLAVLLWAVAHLLVNGSLANVLLFATFLVWSLLDLLSLRHRNDHPLPGLPATVINDIIAVVVGLAIYAVFALWLHAQLFGTPVISLSSQK
jgi:uncharacterized membrane protein